MLVEHSFVTTLDRPDAIDRASRILEVMGFAPATGSSGNPGTGEGNLTMARITGKAKKAARPTDWPQHALISFDRHRIAVAIRIECAGRRSFQTGTSTLDDCPKKYRQVVEDILVFEAAAVECALGDEAQLPAKLENWHERISRLDALYKRGTQRKTITLIVIFSILVILVGIVVAAN